MVTSVPPENDKVVPHNHVPLDDIVSATDTIIKLNVNDKINSSVPYICFCYCPQM